MVWTEQVRHITLVNPILNLLRQKFPLSPLILGIPRLAWLPSHIPYKLSSIAHPPDTGTNDDSKVLTY